MSTPRIVVLGMMSKMPVAGVVWQNLHYLIGLRELGFDVYYVEAHARTPSMLMREDSDDSAQLAAEFIDGVLRPFGFGERWAFHALHDDDRCFGMSHRELFGLYRSAELLLNLHGSTVPRPEHVGTGRLVFIETDPVEVQLELYAGSEEAREYLAPHEAFFTFGENYGTPGSSLPVSSEFVFRPTRQPVVTRLWESHGIGRADRYTTIGNWAQDFRTLSFHGTSYSWSKRDEFLKILDLPRRTSAPLELALASYEPHDQRVLEEAGWRVRPALSFSTDRDSYRSYIARSRGELTVAKEQNVFFRTGWFSDRSATYLAAGRPVITQDVGFGDVLPTGEGLLAFATIDEAADALARVERDYGRHRRAARAIAKEHFEARTVLRALLDDIGVSLPYRRPAERSEQAPIAPELALRPLGRKPTRLAAATEAWATSRGVPGPPEGTAVGQAAVVSVIVVTFDNLVFNRLCLETILAEPSALELIVVDNASSDGTFAYLEALAVEDPRVRVLALDENLGFARAVNLGLAAAAGELLVLLNNDTIVTEGWLSRLTDHLVDERIGMVGPVTNQAPNEARLAVDPSDFTAVRAVADACAAGGPSCFDIPVLTMFCVALRRAVYERVGPLDEQFAVGMFEDDDYSHRVRAIGLRTVCAEDVYVHHFGEASFGKLVPSGAYGEIFRANRARFERKWGPWEHHRRRRDDDYVGLVDRVHALVRQLVPEGATVAVVSKGDTALVELPSASGRHYPVDESGGWAGHYPADDVEAVAQLEHMRSTGVQYLVVPASSIWWLEHYVGLAAHLRRVYRPVAEVAGTAAVFDVRTARADAARV